MSGLALREAYRAQRVAALAIEAVGEKLKPVEGKECADFDTRAVLALARLLQVQHNAWCRARTLLGKPVLVRDKPRDRTPAGRAQRAAQRKLALQAQPGAIAPIGPIAPAPVACMPDPGCSAPTPMPTPSTQSDATTPAPSDDAKESFSSA